MSIATSLVNVSTKIEKKRLLHYHEDVDWENILLLKWTRTGLNSSTKSNFGASLHESITSKVEATCFLVSINLTENENERAWKLSITDVEILLFEHSSANMYFSEELTVQYTKNLVRASLYCAGCTWKEISIMESRIRTSSYFRIKITNSIRTTGGLHYPICWWTNRPSCFHAFKIVYCTTLKPDLSSSEFR